MIARRRQKIVEMLSAYKKNRLGTATTTEPVKKRIRGRT